MLIAGETVEWFYFQIPTDILGAFRQRKQYITLLEAMLVLAALTVWRSYLAGKAYFYFGDNDGSKYPYSKGYSKDADLNFLVGLYWLHATADNHRPWFARVCSDDNPTDGISRRDESTAQRLRWKELHPDLSRLWSIMSKGLSSSKVPTLDLLNE